MNIGVAGLSPGLQHGNASQRVHTATGVERIEEIARGYGLTPEALRDANPGLAVAMPGDRVVLPDTPGALARTGVLGMERLEAFAQRHGVSVEELLAYNGLTAAQVYPGTALSIPQQLSASSLPPTRGLASETPQTTTDGGPTLLKAQGEPHASVKPYTLHIPTDRDLGERELLREIVADVLWRNGRTADAATLDRITDEVYPRDDGLHFTPTMPERRTLVDSSRGYAFTIPSEYQHKVLALAAGLTAPGTSSDRIPLASAQQLMGQVLSGRYQDDAGTISATLRSAGLNETSQSTGVELFRTYQRVVDPYEYTTKGLGVFQQDLAKLEKLTITAAEQGVINLATQRKLLSQVSEWKRQFAPLTPQQIEQRRITAEGARVDGINSPQMKPYHQMLDDMKYLRDSFAARNNVSLGAGPGHYHVAKGIISKTDGLEKAIATGDAKQVESFVDNNDLKHWKRHSIREWADQLTASDAWHKQFFDNAHGILEKFGTVPYAASKILSNVMKAQREGKPMSTAVYNTVVDVASELLVKKYTGKVGDLALRTVTEFARHAATDFAKDPTPEGLGKALSNGFYKALAGLTGDVVKSLTPEQRQELAKLLTAIGAKFLEVNVVKPAVERAFAP